jgi:hypothetical protein
MFSANSRLINESYSFYGKKAEQKIFLDNPNKEFEDEFMGADITINVADYLVFPTMEDMVHEIVPFLLHRVIKGKKAIRVIFSNPSFKPTGDPLYIIDGKMTKSTEYFLSIKPTDVLTIKVEKDINKISRLGMLGKNGIVYVQTKKEVAAKEKLGEEDYVVAGLVSPLKERSPINLKSRQPDFRSTLYWNPQIKTDANGEAIISFQLSDDVGKMKINISGITEAGHTITGEKLFDVRFKRQ